MNLNVFSNAHCENKFLDHYVFKLYYSKFQYLFNIL